MNDQTVKWKEQVDKLTGLYLDAFNQVSGSNINTPGHGNGWSIGQITDHVIKLNESYFPIFDQLLDGSYRPHFFSKIPFLPATFGNLLLKYVDANSKKKTKTMPLWEPSSKNYDAVQIYDKFQDHQQELSHYIEKMDDLYWKRKIIHSPASGFIVYHLETAIDIILEHEERHYNQIINML